ncbi:hypothetical protein FNU76_04005 [Chitinimonas arctica]|uniref:CTP synthase (glutamine hydrolyzing) n=1 Tax=Chitinimonas arctica TaxID=2594795 RepID=A0A516SBQ9_9NEIS|nr:CTP synthase [Chitinimonas arctica]QDQ25582.1 hypothetical protein FNU76_04005 [Chitinimonas arctica]
MSMQTVHIALVGDHDKTVPAHQAIPIALHQAAEQLGLAVSFEWLPTDGITHARSLAGFDGIWCVPASPYRDMDGALLAIRHAREQGIPFLGSCGGFQHALIEYARNQLGWQDAVHGETTPDGKCLVIAPLACALVEVRGGIQLVAGSHIAQAYGTVEIDEGYHCRYGLNPAFAEQLLSGPLRASGHDANGEIRAVELTSHPFFVATLFQSERAALAGRLPPLAAAFLQACAKGSS